jgi:methanogenic corrinoid protein MtbC1
VKWLIARQDEGLRISQAADLWHRQTAEGRNPLEDATQAKNQAAVPSFNGKNVDAFKSEWVSACLSFDDTRAEQIIAEAFSQYPPETVCFDILFEGLSEIGEEWYRGIVSVQQEHFASALVARRLNTLVSGTPPPNRLERIVIAAPPEEEHTLSSLLITFLLRRRGWDVVYLGADVPIGKFRNTLETLNPEMVVLTAHQLFTAATLLDLTNELAGLQTTLAVGGLIFSRIPNLSEHIPGHFLGDDLREVVPNIEQLLRNPVGRQEIPKNQPSPLLEQFRSKLPAIESRISELITDQPNIPSTIVKYLSRDILAAIKLGEISILSINIEWVHGMLSNVQVPDQVLSNFLQIYHQAVGEILGSNGAPVLDWLQSEIDHSVES